jgi:hypothetical protein
MIDTGAAHHSTAGYSQYVALKRYQNIQIDKTKAGAITVQFGIGSATSIGAIEVKTPIGNINFHIVQADTPFLLSLKDLDLLGAYFNNLTNRIYYGANSSKSIPIVRRFGHPFLLWESVLTTFVASFCSATDIDDI